MQKKVLRELKGKQSKYRWLMGPLTINAYYVPNFNVFTLPIGILQYPFYDSNLSDQENLAAMGTVIGHELGHAIDDKGSHFDHNGKRRNWMTGNDLKQFKLKSLNLVDQFNKIGHNGEFTLGENIGDLVGLTTSYKAAFPKTSNIGEHQEKDREAKKRFFLAYARLWCGVERPEYTQMRLKLDPHSLGHARVNEQFKHQEGAIEAFQCKNTHNLYLSPEQRVRIW